MKLYPYNAHSASAKALCEALNIRRVKREGKPIHVDLLINWGASALPERISYDSIVNHPNCVADACDKLETFKRFHTLNVPCPEWTENYDLAYNWLHNEETVVVREVLNGHSGAGISIVTPEGFDRDGKLPMAPLYTKYIKKDQEYRIHVFRGEVIFKQRKARKKDIPDEKVDWKIRNLAGGFIFANVDVVAPQECQQAAIQAVTSCGLDFGAVDICTEKGTGKAFCLEVNTACGLQGSTIEAYVKAFQTITV